MFEAEGCVMPVRKGHSRKLETTKQARLLEGSEGKEAARDEFGRVSREHGTGSVDLGMELGI